MELARLQKEYLIDLEDAVVAIRQPDGKVNLKQSINLVGLGAERTRAMSSRGDSSTSVAVQPSMQRLPLRPIFAKQLQGLVEGVALLEIGVGMLPALAIMNRASGLAPGPS